MALSLALALAPSALASSGGTTAPSKSTPSRHVTHPPSKTHGVSIASASCVPAAHCSTKPHQVSQRGELLIKGTELKTGMVVAFPHSPGARIARNSPTAHLANSTLGLIVHVPSTAHSGRIMILLSHGRHSNAYGPIQVVKYALHPPDPPPPAPVAVGAVGTSPFEGQGMWIWYVSQSDGGNLTSIIAQAKAADVSTLFIKSSDGSTNYWSQFSPELVATLHANGLHICAWQYVYGTNPAGEAELGARAVQAGADCLVIDAESEYEGKYGAAQTYIADLRAKIGAAYPLGLASFPYVYYHTSFPYSVFLARTVPSSTRRRCIGRRSGTPSTPPTPTPISPTASTAGRSSRWAKPTKNRPPKKCCASVRRRPCMGQAVSPSGTFRKPPPTCGRHWPHHSRR